MSEKLESLDVGEKLKNMEKRLTDLVDSTIGEAMAITCDKVEKIYAAVVAMDKTTCGKPKGAQKVENQKSNHKINQSLRIQVLTILSQRTLN